MGKNLIWRVRKFNRIGRKGVRPKVFWVGWFLNSFFGHQGKEGVGWPGFNIILDYWGKLLKLGGPSVGKPGVGNLQLQQLMGN